MIRSWIGKHSVPLSSITSFNLHVVRSRFNEIYIHPSSSFVWLLEDSVVPARLSSIQADEGRSREELMATEDTTGGVHLCIAHSLSGLYKTESFITMNTEYIYIPCPSIM